jgi:hypothetical protein
MAGVKITALPELLTAPVSGDKLVIVDVSDTSEAPTGTTKQVDFDLAIPTSGTWTPTVSDIAGAATVEILGISTYQRIGNLITDNCRISVQLDTGQSSETFNLDLAVPPAANFINARQVTAIYSIESSIPEVDAISIQSLTGSKLTAIPIIGNGTALLITFVCQRTYQYTV